MSKAQAKQAMRLHSSRGIGLKAAWAIVKRGGGSTAKRKGSKGKRHKGGGGYRSYISRAGSHLKGGRIPMTLSYLVGGGAAEIFNLAPTQRQKFFAGLTQVARELGINMVINGYTLAAGLLALNALAAVSPWAGAKINAFLGRFYVRL